MSQINITNFPDEILEKIFWNLYNSEGSLKLLTEVCKRFNDVICSRTKFMSKFVAICNWEKTSVEALLASSRKYQEIKIIDTRDVASKSLIKFLKMQNKSLTSIVVYHCEADVSKLMKIFKAVKNIGKIRIEDVSILCDQWPLPLNLPMLKKITLRNIENNGVTPLLDIFQGAKNVEDFELNDIEGHLQIDELFYEHLPTLLSKFTKLKRFVNKFFVYPVFEDEWLDENITYQLEELSLAFDTGSDGEFDSTLSYNDNIITYINKQKHSLKKLNLGGFIITNEIIECAFSIDQLTELTIGNCKFDSEPRLNILNHSIKKLNFGGKSINADLNVDEDVRYMLSNCKNVEEVSFASMNITKEVSSLLAAQNNIEKLNFISCKIFPMTYSSVKYMELRDIRKYFNDMIKVMRINRQLKHLVLPDKIQTHKRYKTAMEALKLENLEFYPVRDNRV